MNTQVAALDIAARGLIRRARGKQTDFCLTNEQKPIPAKSYVTG